VNFKPILEEVEALQGQMTQTLIQLVRIPAIGPESGGNGEMEKANKLAQILKNSGFAYLERFDAKDSRIPGSKRPNIIATVPGETKERLWIVTHLDIVPPGEDALWTISKAFDPVVKGEKIYGRGVEDNGQAMVSSIYAAKALLNLGIKPRRNIMLCFVADEEQGSKFGIRYLIDQNLFRKDDLIVVPDGGESDGGFIEIAEKSQLWLKITTFGRQTHASMPSKGLNAHRAGMEFAIALDKMLHKKYSAKEDYFTPPESTFEPTKKEKNVDAVNIVPGEDILYFDCRILPRYNTEKVLKEIKLLATGFEQRSGAKITIEPLTKNIAPKPTDPNAKIVTMLREAIIRTRRVKPSVGGIGGGTCAAFFRKSGIPAAVWSTVDEMAHQPNEYAKIKNMTDDAKVFAHMAMA
jgi:succinyl-diaminopimelate desuccinylase